MNKLWGIYNYALALLWKAEGSICLLVEYLLTCKLGEILPFLFGFALSVVYNNSHSKVLMIILLYNMYKAKKNSTFLLKK